MTEELIKKNQMICNCILGVLEAIALISLPFIVLSVVIVLTRGDQAEERAGGPGL